MVGDTSSQHGQYIVAVGQRTVECGEIQSECPVILSSYLQVTQINPLALYREHNVISGERLRLDVLVEGYSHLIYRRSAYIQVGLILHAGDALHLQLLLAACLECQQIGVTIEQAVL